jgi:tetratricopeptide (TPR) repeat protein
MLGSKYRGRRKGVTVRAGSVEQARRDAKLTLAQVAAGTVTRTAIHLIEKGRTRPSMETLQQIARQTRKPLDFFLLDPQAPPAMTERQAQLRELERLSATRELHKVIELGTSLLEAKWSADDAAMIRFSIGQACCRLVQPADALPHLRRARSEFERLGDEWMAVEALDWESSAMGLLDNPDALPLANEALERCRRLEPKAPQIEARILGHIAGMYVASESWSLAIGYYQAAAEAASGVRDLLQLAKMHHGLGIAYQYILQPATARQHLDKAMTLYSIERDLGSILRVENDLGDLLLKQGQLDAAERHLVQALQGFDQLDLDRRGRGYVLLGLGEVELRRGSTERATQYLLQAWDSGVATGERIVIAKCRLLLGQVEERNENRSFADEHFDAAIRILEELRMSDPLRDAHMAYAELLDARLDAVAASRHWKRAAEIGKVAAMGLKWAGAAGAEFRESLA